MCEFDETWASVVVGVDDPTAFEEIGNCASSEDGARNSHEQWRELGSALRVALQPHPEVRSAGDVPVNVPLNVPVNGRQRWLIDQLANGGRPKAGDVAAHFGVTEKTVRRDIADLKEQGFIEFVGAPKTGFYRLKGPAWAR